MSQRSLELQGLECGIKTMVEDKIEGVATAHLYWVGEHKTGMGGTPREAKAGGNRQGASAR